VPKNCVSKLFNRKTLASLRFNQPPLDLPFVIGGLGHVGKVHSSNEYFVVKGIRDNEKSIAPFLYEYAC
jgi:hypothetical protein